MYEHVKAPQHYHSRSGQQAIDVIQDFGLNFALGNVIKYVIRAGKKPGEDRLQDLKKALEYIQFEIKDAERSAKSEQTNGSNMPEGFKELSSTSDWRGLAQYTCGPNVLDFGAAPYERENVTELGKIFDTVSDQITDELRSLHADGVDRADLADLVDILVQAVLLLSRMKN